MYVRSVMRFGSNSAPAGLPALSNPRVASYFNAVEGHAGGRPHVPREPHFRKRPEGYRAWQSLDPFPVYATTCPNRHMDRTLVSWTFGLGHFDMRMHSHGWYNWKAFAKIYFFTGGGAWTGIGLAYLKYRRNEGVQKNKGAVFGLD